MRVGRRDGRRQPNPSGQRAHPCPSHRPARRGRRAREHHDTCARAGGGGALVARLSGARLAQVRQPARSAAAGTLARRSGQGARRNGLGADRRGRSGARRGGRGRRTPCRPRTPAGAGGTCGAPAPGAAVDAAGPGRLAGEAARDARGAPRPGALWPRHARRSSARRDRAAAVAPMAPEQRTGLDARGAGADRARTAHDTGPARRGADLRRGDHGLDACRGRYRPGQHSGHPAAFVRERGARDDPVGRTHAARPDVRGADRPRAAGGLLRRPRPGRVGHRLADGPGAQHYERIRERFNRRFNAHAPAWEDDGQDGGALDAYPDILGRLQAAWSTPAQAGDLLEALLFRRDAASGRFDLPAYEELLFLYAVARDRAQHEGGIQDVDLLLPFASTDDTPAIMRAHATPPPEPRQGKSVDVDLDFDAPGPAPAGG